jgi:Methyltransferase domain
MDLPGLDERIDRLDLSLFDAIDSQSDAGDRRSWLALQRAVRRRHGSYTYLEIGSHLGGSLQPHLLDPRCRAIYSIDKRPVEAPDDRGQQPEFRYEGNSTARMLANLRALDPAQVAKVICFDSDARNVDSAALASPPDLCFIDGEHTERAVLSDFDFCARVCAPRVIIGFHDDWVVYPALSRILRTLSRQGRPFAAAKLQGSTFAIALGAVSLPADDFLREVAVDGRWFILRMRARRFLKRWMPPTLLPLIRRLRRRP